MSKEEVTKKILHNKGKFFPILKREKTFPKELVKVLFSFFMSRFLFRSQSKRNIMLTVKKKPLVTEIKRKIMINMNKLLGKLLD